MPKKEMEKKIFLHSDHPKPITRREFLASGAIDLCGYALVPGALHYLLGSRSAFGIPCASVISRTDLAPFLVFDLVGGASLSGNFLVGKEGGSLDYLSTYNKMGIPNNPKDGEPVDTRFGVPMLTNLSKVYAGILSQTSATNLRMATLCSASTDDTPNNLLSPIALVARTGLIGKHIANPVSNINTSSGGISTGPLVEPGMRPVLIDSAGSLVTTLSYGYGLSGHTKEQRDAVAKAILSLSRTQQAKFASMNLGLQFTALAECGYIKNAQYTDTSSLALEVDPRQDANARAAYGLTTTSSGNATSAIVYNVLKGNTGPGVLAFGGCDYHDGTQTSGDEKDFQIGEEIGRAVELARRMGKKLFFALISDGANYSDEDTRIWRGDAGSMGLGVIGYFDPAAPPAMRRTQVGFFREGQGVERTTYIGNDPKRAAYAMLLNYLSASGRMSEFQNYVSVTEFDPAQYDAHLVFG